jgi:hypothetical protein
MLPFPLDHTEKACGILPYESDNIWRKVGKFSGRWNSHSLRNGEPEIYKFNWKKLVLGLWKFTLQEF